MEELYIIQRDLLGIDVAIEHLYADECDNKDMWKEILARRQKILNEDINKILKIF